MQTLQTCGEKRVLPRLRSFIKLSLDVVVGEFIFRYTAHWRKWLPRKMIENIMSYVELGGVNHI